MRKKTVRWTVFADVATSVSEAIGTVVPENDRHLHQKSKEHGRKAVFFAFFSISKMVGIEQGGSKRSWQNKIDRLFMLKAR